MERKGFFFMELGDEWIHDDWNRVWRPTWKVFKPDDREDLIFIREMSVDFDVPHDFDPREKQIKVLEAQKREMTAKFQAAVTEINARIQNLQAIEWEHSNG